MKNRFAQQTLKYIWTHPNCQQKKLQAIARFVGWQFYKRLTQKYLDIPLIPPLKLRCYPDSAAASAVLYCGLYDYDEMNFILRYLRAGDSFLDLGANIGVYTLLAAAKIQSGNIYSIEALPKNYDRLQENIALNGLQNVCTYAVAATDYTGTVRLEVAEGDCLPHLAREGETTTGISVPCYRLDDLLQDELTENLTLAKMDIEGAELLALQGATTWLERQCPPVWIVEVVFQEREFVEFWQRYDYRFYRYRARENRLEAVEWGDVAGKNVFAIANSALELTRERLQILR